MAATDLQQPEMIPQITGPLGDFVEFKNGRSSPDRTDSGAFAVYGSNGEIGKADVTNAPEGTLVVGRVGSYCGSVHYSPNKCWVTDNAIIGSSRSQKDSRFWFYKLASLDLNNYRAGSGQPLLNQQVLNSIQVSIPASEDDRFQIAKVLAAFDDKIDLNRRVNQTLEAMAQAIFKSWFVDFDPVKAKIAAIAEGRDPLRAAMAAISGKSDAGLDALPPEQYAQLAATAALFPDEMEESELGEIPRGWSAKPLDTVANYLNGLALQKFPPKGDSDFLPVIKIAQLRAGHVDGADRAASDLKAEFIVCDGDVLFSWSGSLEVDVWTGGRGALNQHLFKVTSSTVPKWFYLCATKYHLPEFREIAANKATTMGHIQRKHLSDARIATPTTEFFTQSSKVLSPVLDEIVLLRLQSRDLAKARDTLLPKLLSGELSVTEATAEAEA